MKSVNHGGKNLIIPNSSSSRHMSFLMRSFLSLAVILMVDYVVGVNVGVNAGVNILESNGDFTPISRANSASISSSFLWKHLVAKSGGPPLPPPTGGPPLGGGVVKKVVASNPTPEMLQCLIQMKFTPEERNQINAACQAGKLLDDDCLVVFAEKVADAEATAKATAVVPVHSEEANAEAKAKAIMDAAKVTWDTNAGEQTKKETALKNAKLEHTKAGAETAAATKKAVAARAAYNEARKNADLTEGGHVSKPTMEAAAAEAKYALTDAEKNRDNAVTTENAAKKKVDQAQTEADNAKNATEQANSAFLTAKSAWVTAKAALDKLSPPIGGSPPDDGMPSPFGGPTAGGPTSSSSRPELQWGACRISSLLGWYTLFERAQFNNNVQPKFSRPLAESCLNSVLSYTERRSLYQHIDAYKKKSQYSPVPDVIPNGSDGFIDPQQVIPFLEKAKIPGAPGVGPDGGPPSVSRKWGETCAKGEIYALRDSLNSFYNNVFLNSVLEKALPEPKIIVDAGQIPVVPEIAIGGVDVGNIPVVPEIEETISSGASPGGVLLPPGHVRLPDARVVPPGWGLGKDGTIIPVPQGHVVDPNMRIVQAYYDPENPGVIAGYVMPDGTGKVISGTQAPDGSGRVIPEGYILDQNGSIIPADPAKAKGKAKPGAKSKAGGAVDPPQGYHYVYFDGKEILLPKWKTTARGRSDRKHTTLIPTNPNVLILVFMSIWIILTV